MRRFYSALVDLCLSNDCSKGKTSDGICIVVPLRTFNGGDSRVLGIEGCGIILFPISITNSWNTLASSIMTSSTDPLFSIMFDSIIGDILRLILGPVLDYQRALLLLSCRHARVLIFPHAPVYILLVVGAIDNTA